MAMTKINTRQYKKEGLIELSKKVAEESGTEWVDYEQIEEYNHSLKIAPAGALKKAIWFCINDQPYVAVLICTVLFGVIFALIMPLLAVFGAILGLCLSSFLVPALYKNCSLCRSRKSCEKIFEHVISYQQHTEKRRKDNGTEISVTVRNENVFVVLECKKCKGRKIEIISRQKEKLL